MQEDDACIVSLLLKALIGIQLSHLNNADQCLYRQPGTRWGRPCVGAKKSVRIPGSERRADDGASRRQVLALTHLLPISRVCDKVVPHHNFGTHRCRAISVPIPTANYIFPQSSATNRDNNKRPSTNQQFPSVSACKIAEVTIPEAPPLHC